MYFLNEKEKKVLNCPSCSETFIKGKGANCLDNCPDKQLENKHKKAISQIINYCLPNREIKVNCPLDKPITAEKVLWGRTYYSIGEIDAPWYTLRSKKRFIHCIAHEVSHITDYEKKFTVEERKIVGSYFRIKQQRDESSEKEKKERLSLRMKLYEKKHQWLFNKLKEFEDKLHSREGWYQEYLENHQKIIKSTWWKYAYGNLAPLPYEQFIRDLEANKKTNQN